MAGHRITIASGNIVVPKIAQVDVPVSGVKLKKDLVVTASYSEYVAGTLVSIVKKEKQETGKQGLFKGYKFQPLERKVQTLWNDGYILINTKDPVNDHYFGDDPGKAVEEKSHCQVLLADMILNECLQIMVSQALETGKLDRRYPNNPEIDVRSYVDEKKFEIGAEIHKQFAPNL